MNAKEKELNLKESLDLLNECSPNHYPSPYFCYQCKFPNKLRISKDGITHFSCNCEKHELYLNPQQVEEMKPEDIAKYTYVHLPLKKFNEMVDFINSDIICINHDTTKAFGNCSQCQSSFCEDCTKEHEQNYPSHPICFKMFGIKFKTSCDYPLCGAHEVEYFEEYRNSYYCKECSKKGDIKN